MFDELNAAFPDHTHFYEVVGLPLAEAMDQCARLTAGEVQVVNYQGKIIFAVQHYLSVSGAGWLVEVPGAPEEAVVEEAVVEETVVDDTTLASSKK